VVGLTEPAPFSVHGGWPGILGRLTHREDLAVDEAAAAFGEILAGEATPAQVAAFVAALRTKGETVEELTGFVRSMRQHAQRIPALEGADDLVDTCGTGGDRSGSINVSTIAALVAAGAGCRICKHGGRAASSVAGSADVLEALGVVIDLDPGGVARCIEEAGIGFCFAPRFHPAMRHAAPVRRELGIATVFNFLGPLANPALVVRQVIGVGDASMASKMLGVLEANGARHAMVVHGNDGLDELSTVAPSRVLEIRDGERRTFEVDAGDLGIAPATREALRGGDAAANAVAARRVLGGEHGPHRDVVLLNAAAALVVAGRVPDLAGGISVGAESIDSGAAAAALARLIEVSAAAAG
jgi:anthranilate phosphoribosyltransferase